MLLTKYVLYWYWSYLHMLLTNMYYIGLKVISPSGDVAFQKQNSSR